MSHHTLAALRSGGRVSQQSILSLAKAAEDLRVKSDQASTDNEHWRKVGLQMMIEVGGRNKLAGLLGVSAPYLGRVLHCEKPMTNRIITAMDRFRSGHPLG